MDKAVFRIFVASPSDVKRERELVKGIAEELNLWSKLSGLNIEVVEWETDASPGLHPEGPQGLIDERLRITESDLLIGIFWHRFGTPTASGETGTEHEIRLSYESWKLRRRPEIMLYFNEKPYNPVGVEDIQQWAQVRQFRAALPGEAFTWSYKGPAAFEEVCRKHLVGRIVATTEERQSSAARPGRHATGSLHLALRNHEGEPLGEPVDVFLQDLEGSHSFKVLDALATDDLAIHGLSVRDNGAYWVLVRPRRYYSATRSITFQSDRVAHLEITLPVRSDKVADYVFPTTAPLPRSVRQLLDACGPAGHALYTTAPPAARASLHNFAAVLPFTELGGADSLVEYLETLVKLSEERCFFRASQKLVAALSDAAAHRLLKPVPSTLHHPPDGYRNAGAYRREFGAFSLGLYVFKGDKDCTMECDFDTHGGLERLFVVERGFYGLITPSDVYQVLTAAIRLNLGYTLALVPAEGMSAQTD